MRLVAKPTFPYTRVVVALWTYKLSILYKLRAVSGRTHLAKTGY